MKNVRYTPLLFAIDLFKKSKKIKINTTELKQLYEEKHKKKYSTRTYTRIANKLHKLGYCHIERTEKLWLLKGVFNGVKHVRNGHQSDTNSMYDLTVLNGISIFYKKYHEAHKIRLSTKYNGQQPLEDATDIRPLGRYKTGNQGIYRINSRITILTYKNKLNVWVHRPQGTLTKEQMINAKAEGFRELLKFAKSHNLELQGYLDKVMQSHHVVVDEELNELLKPTFEKYGDIIKERLGSDICQSSHKGQIEHEGVVREDKRIIGEKISNGLEYLCLEYPTIHKQTIAYAHEIKNHREAINELKEGNKKLKESLDLLYNLLNKVLKNGN